MQARTSILYLCLLAAAPSSAASLQDLHWLLGCWQNEDGSAQEAWVEEADGSLVGFGVTIENDRLSFYELLTITEGADGVLVYTAHPEGESRTSFRLATLSEGSVTFTNPAHDFPQEIAYRFDGETLIATISLLDGERPRSFPKQRCG